MYPIANAPTSWGVESADGSQNPPWRTFLAEVAASGYQGTELGPLGYLKAGRALDDALRQESLRLVGGYVLESFHDVAALDEILERAGRTCEVLEQHGARYVVLISSIVPARTATAGRSAVAPRLSDAEFDAQTNCINEIGALARRHGLQAGVHSHAGTYIEFEDELDGVLAAVSPELCGLVLDTGHAAYAGMDPVALIDRHGERLIYLHLKDVDSAKLEAARSGGLDFWEAYAASIFTPLGCGMNDFAAIRDALGRIEYAGWLTVEQDADPASESSPIRDAAASYEFLQSLGLASV